MTDADPLIEVEGGGRADYDVLPIFFCQELPPPDTPKILSFEGTGFRLAPDLLITCWHCVDGDAAGHGYAVALPKDSGGYQMHALVDVSRDEKGADLATARIYGIDSAPRLGLSLASRAVPGGTDVGTWGYPLTEMTRLASGDLEFKLGGRWLQGYITRAFWHEHAEYGSVPTYELDMPTPRGLSGAPLVRLESRDVVGVIYGTHDASLIEEIASVDPDSGERRPEVQRIVSFGLAHYTSTLRDLRGPATEGKPLADYLAGRSVA